MAISLRFTSIIIIFSSLFVNGQNYSNQIFDTSNEIKSKSYKVTETINSTFGGRKIFYTVSNKSLINTNDLGPNNTREIEEVIVYKKKKNSNNIVVNNNFIKEEKKDEMANSEKVTSKTISIDPLKTYERMVDKGIKSVEILKLLGDSYFYKNNFLKASSYYEALFNLTNDLRKECYLRFYKSLIGSGQIEKAKVFIKKYSNLVTQQ
jgi:tetratricopeptide (TPR) repeat protein